MICGKRRFKEKGIINWKSEGQVQAIMGQNDKTLGIGGQSKV